MGRTHVHLAVVPVHYQVDAFHVFKGGFPVGLALLEDRFELRKAMLYVFITAKCFALKGLFKNLGNFQILEMVFEIEGPSSDTRTRIVNKETADIFSIQPAVQPPAENSARLLIAPHDLDPQRTGTANTFIPRIGNDDPHCRVASCQIGMLADDANYRRAKDLGDSFHSLR
jgi:hypothetical protein